MKRIPVVVAFVFFLSAAVEAALVTNSPMPITQRVSVNVIAVQNSDGSQPAPLFGTPSQQTSIFDLVDSVWAQAGIDIDFTLDTVYMNDFANFGTLGNNDPRPDTDLGQILTNASSVRKADALDLFMVNIVPFFDQSANNQANGLARVGDDGMAMWVGPSLPTGPSGRDVAASVLAHEIGHNLGLFHTVTNDPSLYDNLMYPGTSSNPGDRLNSSQITTARATAINLGVATAVPEPNAFLLLGLVAGLYGVKRFVAARVQSPAANSSNNADVRIGKATVASA